MTAAGKEAHTQRANNPPPTPRLVAVCVRARRWYTANAHIVWPDPEERPTLRQALLHAKGYKLRPDGVIAEYWQKRRQQEKSGEKVVRQPQKVRPGGAPHFGIVARPPPGGLRACACCMQLSQAHGRQSEAAPGSAAPALVKGVASVYAMSVHMCGPSVLPNVCFEM